MAKVTLDGHEIDTLVLTPASGTAVTKSLVATNTYAAGDAGKIVKNTGSAYELIAQTARSGSITVNGTYDTTENNSVTVAVPVPTGTKEISISANGTTTEDVSGYASAEITVNVSGGGSTLQTKSVTLTSATEEITPDQGYDGMTKVTVTAPLDASQTVTPTTSQQTITPSSGKIGLAGVTVDAAPIQASKSVTPTTSQQTVTPDTGYIGIAQVIVGAASGGSTLQTKSVTLTSATEEITPDQGYDGMTKVTVTAPLDASQTVTPTTSQQTITPSSGKIGLAGVTVDAAPIQASKSVTPTTSPQTITPDPGYIGLAQVVVAAGGGGSMLTGSFTPESATLTYTIPELVNTDKEHILFYAVGGVSNALITDVRSIGAGFFGFDSVAPCYWGVSSNGSGTNMAGVPKGNTAGAPNYFAFDRTTGTLIFANSANSGYLAPCAYEWIAW